MIQALRHYLLAVQFFTRIPVTGRLAQWVGYSPEMLRASTAHFPAVGWLVGSLGAGAIIARYGSGHAYLFVAAAYLAQLEAAGVYAGPIQTSIEDMDTFFVAERHHHDYAARNPGQPYIQYVSMPKVEKLLRYFPAISSSA